MAQLFPIAAITDEFSPDIEKSVRSMSEIGMTAAELRMVFGKNIIDLSDEEVDRAKHICAERGMKVISIASPVLKCTLPDSPPVDERFQQDMFAAAQAFLRENTKTVTGLEELYERARTNAGFSLAGWCGAEECETKVKNESRATIRCLPFDQPEDQGTCVVCGKPATAQAVFSRAY